MSATDVVSCFKDLRALLSESFLKEVWNIWQEHLNRRLTDWGENENCKVPLHLNWIFYTRKRARRMMCWSTGGTFTPEKFAEKEYMKSWARWNSQKYSAHILGWAFCVRLASTNLSFQFRLMLSLNTTLPLHLFPNPQITPVNYSSTSESSHIPLSSTER